MAKKRVIVLGAGLTGLSIAWHLKKAKIDAFVFEGQSQVGGLCRSKKINRFTFDYCGHLLHFKHTDTFKLVNHLLDSRLIEHKREAWIYIFKRYIPYPFQANFYHLPEAIKNECLAGFLLADRQRRAGKRSSINFSQWIYRNFGKAIARYFMIPYNSKFWKVSPSDLTSDWAINFIPLPDPKEVLKSMLRGQGQEYGYNHKFWYPEKGGINRLPVSLAQGLKNIRTGSRAIAIDLDKKTIKFSTGEKERFDILVSTIPIPDIPGLVVNLPPRISSAIKLLKWNSILNINLGLKQRRLTGKHWIYFPQKHPGFFRLGCFSNFSPAMAPANSSSLYAEIAYAPGAAADENQYIKKTLRDLKGLEIIDKFDDVATQDVNNIKYAYPVYDFNRKNALKTIASFLNGKSCLSVGRYGGWKYLSMEDAILEGKATACLIQEKFL